MARHRKPDSTGLPASSPGSSPAARILRAIIPALIILSWLAAAAVGGPYFGRVSEISTNDSSCSLPTTSASTQGTERLPDYLGSEAIPPVVVITSPQELTEEQLQELKEAAATLGDLVVLAGQASPAIP